MQDWTQQSDDQLMVEVCKGNHDAFAALVARHTQNFYALAYRTLQQQEDAHDIVQAAFIKLWQKPQLWKADKSKFSTWFYRVIINACHDHRRKYARSVNVDDTVFEQLATPLDSEQTTLEQKQALNWQQQALECAISKLSSSQRDALNLVVYSELPQKQAAEILGVSVKALESLLIRAKRSMAKTVNEFEVSGVNIASDSTAYPNRISEKV